MARVVRPLRGFPNDIDAGAPSEQSSRVCGTYWARWSAGAAYRVARPGGRRRGVVEAEESSAFGEHGRTARHLEDLGTVAGAGSVPSGLNAPGVGLPPVQVLVDSAQERSPPWNCQARPGRR